MRKLVVVQNPDAWSLHVEKVEVVSARTYLTDPEMARVRRARVFNLCREYRYLSRGYYVSLLAEARGHAVVPSVKTIQDLKSPPIARIVSEELDELMARSFRDEPGPDVEVRIYFGDTATAGLSRLARELFRLFQAPLLQARFTRRKTWRLEGIRALALEDVPEADGPFLQDAARRYFARRQGPAPARPFPYDLAILVNPEEPFPPSDRDALARFASAAEARGFSVEMVTREDYARIGEFDALLIRETTLVPHHTYRMARRAESEGMPVIDPPDAILKCTNKVFLAEILKGAGLPTPPTRIVHAENRRELASELGLPCVVKVPDSSFSHGVVKADTAEELEAVVDRLLASSALLIAQSYTPSEFDWRIGVLDGEPLFACKYYMARGHWQIYNWRGKSIRDVEGGWETLAVEDAPSGVVEAGVRAAALVGPGLFGVDVKEVDGRPLVIEVNDNPNIDAGVEDAALGADLYGRVVDALKRRMEARLGVRREA